jgi:GTP cyclohydrolase I
VTLAADLDPEPGPVLALHPARTEPDLDAAADAARAFLEALGVPCTGPGMVRSPARMAAAYAELLTPRDFEPTTFPNDEHYDELVVVKEIPVQSVCEHHLAPKGVGVVVEAEHTCMTLRGVRAGGAVTRTSALTGVLREDPSARAEFFAVLNR